MSDHHHFNYIELPATDMAAMKAFYSAVFTSMTLAEMNWLFGQKGLNNDS